MASRLPSLSGSVSVMENYAGRQRGRGWSGRGVQGISRAPVREALYQLETEGLLMSHPKRGRCVTVLTPEGIRNSYELSGLLEGGCGRQSRPGIFLRKFATGLRQLSTRCVKPCVQERPLTNTPHSARSFMKRFCLFRIILFSVLLPAVKQGHFQVSHVSAVAYALYPRGTL